MTQLSTIVLQWLIIICILLLAASDVTALLALSTSTPFSPPPPDGVPDKAEIRSSFEQEYERLFGHIQPDGVLEMTALRVVGTGILPTVPPEVSSPSSGIPDPAERRPVFLDSGLTEVDVYKGAELKPGHRLAGPALIDEDTTTVLIGPDDRLDVDTANNFMIHLSGQEV